MLDDEEKLLEPLRKIQYKKLQQSLSIPQQIKHFPFNPRAQQILPNQYQQVINKASFYLHKKVNSIINNLPNSHEEEPFLIFHHNNNQIPIKQITSKILYQIILPQNLNTNKPWEEKWSNKLNNQHIPWQQFWQSIHSTAAPYEIQTSIWKQITGA